MTPLYATPQDMLDRYDAADLEQLTDGAGAPDEAVLTRRLQSASALVQGYVRAYFDSSKFAAIPALLVDLTCTIALHRLYGTAVPEAIRDQYRDAVRQLEAIAAGRLKLDEGAEPAEPRAGAILTGGESRKFSRTSMESY